MADDLLDSKKSGLTHGTEGQGNEKTPNDNRWKVSDRVRPAKRKRKHRKHITPPTVGQRSAHSVTRADVTAALRTVMAFVSGMRSITPQTLVGLMLDPRMRESVRTLADVKVIDIVRSIQTEPALLTGILEILPGLTAATQTQADTAATARGETASIARLDSGSSVESWFENE